MVGRRTIQAAAYMMQSIRGAWELFFGMTVGIGGVYTMRF